jgi:hypothetical protein
MPLRLAFLLLLIGAPLGRAQLWEYNEPANTPLDQTTGSSGSAWSGPIVGVASDGLGRLEFKPTLATSTRVFLPIAALSSGSYEIKIVLAGWSFQGAPALGPLLEVGLANSNTGLPARTVAHFRLDANASGLALAGSAGGPGSSETSETTDRIFPLVRGTPLTIKLVINFTTGTYQISTSDDGFAQTASGLLATPRRTANYLLLRTAADFTVGGAGALRVERMSFGPVQAVAAYQSWRSAYFTTAELASPAISGDSADPNGDGVPNFMHYALGQNPKTTTSGRPLVLTSAAGVPVLEFRRPRNPVAAGVSHLIETSQDLRSWVLANPSTIGLRDDGDGYETVDLQAVNPGAGDKVFYRLRFISF